MQAIPIDSELARINGLAHTRVQDCYQCGKCTAGCPMAEHMDMTPNQLLRMVQMDQADRAIQSEAIWLCVSCQTCASRCPKSVNCAGVLDALRQLAVERNQTNPAAARTVIFQKVFLDNIRRNGRLKELELVGMFKTKTLLSDLNIPFLFKDSMLAPKMIARGKFHPLGESVKDKAVVGRIFDRCMNGAK